MPRSPAAAREVEVPSPPAPCTSSPELLCEALRVEPARGLSGREAAARRAEYGDNALRRAETRGWPSILVAQFRSLIVGLLAVAAATSLLLGQHVEGLAIIAVLLINATLGFVTELKAVRSMEGLRALGHSAAKVRRDGRVQTLPAEGLVPGDVVLLEAGDMVSADLRLLEAAGVSADESALTGESVPVSKQAGTLETTPPLSERSNMLFKGTALTAGSGEALVVGTGMATELGRISALIEDVDDSDTPLERRLDRLGRLLAWISLAFVAAVVIVGLATGAELWPLLELAIALAVATVPEGLPIVGTLALARGMWRMARRHALIEHLPAVETLGSTNVILTDKTGTLTENRMTVREVALLDAAVTVDGGPLSLEGDFTVDGGPLAPDSAPGLLPLLRAAALCTDAELDITQDPPQPVGDPMEVALLVAAHKAGMPQATLRAGAPELRQVAFDPAVKMMATYHDGSDGRFVAVKGAPEAVLECCTTVASAQGEIALDATLHAQLSERVAALVSRGLRVLAIAQRPVDDVDAPPFETLGLLGFVGLQDPPRLEIVPALRACHGAGIRVVMVTGDHPGTAAAIARAVGLSGGRPEEVLTGAALAPPEVLSAQAQEEILAAPVIARCSPEQKLHLLSLYQSRGFTVGMVGDGVNDAPALRRADIGIAMGLRGTAVAREAAAMVLQDDDFRTIAVAIEQGRVIYGNIRAFVVYLISCNLSEILTVGLATLVGAPLPILPLQILFLNLVTDVFPALALGAGDGDSRVMTRPPRPPGEPFLTRAHYRRIGGYAVVLAAAVLGAFAMVLVGSGGDRVEAVSVAFLTLSLGQLWHVFNMASPGSRLFDNEITRNPWVWGAVALCLLLVAAGFLLPPLAAVLSLRVPDAASLAISVGFSLMPLLVGRVAAALGARRHAHAA